MDVVSYCPLRVASVLWQPRQGAWALTVVCKATYSLLPTTSKLAEAQDEPTPADVYWSDNEGQSLHFGSDLVPFKRRADVVLVGHAYAPRQAPVSSLVARLIVGEVDKSMEVAQDRLVPRGFGPIAPHWPARAQMIPARAAGFSYRTWNERPLPEGLDPSYFNVAPLDQQVDQLRPNERIVMEHLHPEHPRLVTSLPGASPRAVVERNGASEELGLRCDTLVIDTDRGIATLTWRGHLMMEQPNPPGRVSISLAGSLAGIAQPQPQQPPPRKNPALRQTVDASAIEQARAALPFLQNRDAAAPTPFRTPPPSPPPPSPPSPPPPLRIGPDSASRPESPWGTASARSGGMSIGQLAAEAPSPPPVVNEGALEPKAPSEAAAPPRRREPPREIVSLLWFDPKALPRIRRRPLWRPIFDALEESDPDVDLDAEDLDPMAVDEDRRDVLALVARGALTDAAGLRDAVREAIRDDGAFVEPLVLTAGDLALSFDEVELLKATITVVTPFLPTDKALKDLVDGVNDLLKASSLDGSSDVAEGYTARIRDTFGASKRGLPATYLESRTERMLLEQRRYQKRIVLGKTCLRGSFTPAGSDEAMPAYLPDSLAKELPMMKRFSTRLVAEVCLQQDQSETHPHALRAVALGRAASYSAQPR